MAPTAPSSIARLQWRGRRPGRQEAAKALRDLLARDESTGADHHTGPAVDPLHAVDPWRADRRRSTRRGDAVEIELNAAADNPLVLGDDELVLSTGNFHTPALSLAFETLGLAIAQAAAASAARFIQLTGSGRNGLPNICRRSAAPRPASCRCRRRSTAILASIRHKANPVMLDFLPVSEGVEDHATQTPLAVSKCAEMIALWRRLIAFELMAAAQAVDLREGLDAGAGHRRDPCGGARACVDC